MARCQAGPQGVRSTAKLQLLSLALPCPVATADVDRLKLGLAKAEGDIDVLLTCEWPAGLCDGLPDTAKPQGVPLDGAWQGCKPAEGGEDGFRKGGVTGGSCACARQAARLPAAVPSFCWS